MSSSLLKRLLLMLASTPKDHKRFGKMISPNAKNLESVLLAEPHVAVMFSFRTLTRSAKGSCRTLQIAEFGEGLSCQQTAKGASGKGPRQKTTKIDEKCQNIFRHFSTFFVQGKTRQKVSKIFLTFFDGFRAAPIFRPILGVSDLAEPWNAGSFRKCPGREKPYHDQGDSLVWTGPQWTGNLRKKPFETPNRPKPPQTPNFPEDPALPRNPPGIPTEFILSAILNSTEFP